MPDFWMGVSAVLAAIVLALLIVLYLSCKYDELNSIEKKAEDETKNLSDDQLKSSVDKDVS